MGLAERTLEEYLLQDDVLTDKIERFSQRIEELSHERRYNKKPVAINYVAWEKELIQQQR